MLDRGSGLQLVAYVFNRLSRYVRPARGGLAWDCSGGRLGGLLSLSTVVLSI